MRRLILSLFVGLIPAFAAPTQIVDTLYTSAGSPANCRLEIDAIQFNAADGRTIIRSRKFYDVLGGVVNLSLEPNDTSVPAGTSYAVTGNCQAEQVAPRLATTIPYSETWLVPTSATPVTIASIRVSIVPTPTVMFAPSQITQAGATNGQVLSWNGTIWAPASGSGTGTVTSVGLALPAIFTISGSPVTASGTLTAVLANQAANLVWAGPSTGSAAAPTFRALVGADLPVPGAASLGGVDSKDCTSGGQFVQKINTDGTITCATPAGGGNATKITGTATFAFGSAIQDGTCSQGGTTIAVTGAVVGDGVTVGASASLASGVDVAGKVTSSNTVTVEVCNWSGAAVTPASTTYLATVVH